MVWSEMASDVFFLLMLVLPGMLQIELENKANRKEPLAFVAVRRKKRSTLGTFEPKCSDQPFPHRGCVLPGNLLFLKSQYD